MTQEIWKDIDGISGYQVSNIGNVRKLVDGNYVQVNQNETKGYLKVYMNDGSGRHYEFVHRVVAKAFVPNPYYLREVNHIDGNKRNNAVENLEWVTRSQNMQHAYDTGLSSKQCERKLTREQVHFMRKNYIPHDAEYGADGYARRYNIDRATIYRIVSGERYQRDYKDTSAMDGLVCRCPKCHRELFRILEKTYIENLPYICDYCKHEFEVNSIILEKSQKLEEAKAMRKPIQREMIECACGCGTLIENVDAKGRYRKFVYGHQNRKARV